MDEQAKGEVKKLPTYLEDTRDLLQIIMEENHRGPQPPGTVPVILDMSGMYTNIPLEERLWAFEQKMNQVQDRQPGT